MLKRIIPSSGEALPAIGMGTSGSFEITPGSPEYDALKEVLQLLLRWRRDADRYRADL